MQRTRLQNEANQYPYRDMVQPVTDETETNPKVRHSRISEALIII